MHRARRCHHQSRYADDETEGHDPVTHRASIDVHLSGSDGFSSGRSCDAGTTSGNQTIDASEQRRVPKHLAHAESLLLVEHDLACDLLRVSPQAHDAGEESLLDVAIGGLPGEVRKFAGVRGQVIKLEGGRVPMAVAELPPALPDHRSGAVRTVCFVLHKGFIFPRGCFAARER